MGSGRVYCGPGDGGAGRYGLDWPDPESANGFQRSSARVVAVPAMSAPRAIAATGHAVLRQLGAGKRKDRVLGRLPDASGAFVRAAFDVVLAVSARGMALFFANLDVG